MVVQEMQWISIDDGDFERYELANIPSARCKVGAPRSDGDVGLIWSEKIEG